MNLKSGKFSKRSSGVRMTAMILSFKLSTLVPVPAYRIVPGNAYEDISFVCGIYSVVTYLSIIQAYGTACEGHGCELAGCKLAHIGKAPTSRPFGRSSWTSNAE